jgi:hypothetical protein
MVVMPPATLMATGVPAFFRLSQWVSIERLPVKLNGFSMDSFRLKFLASLIGGFNSMAK